MAVKIKINAWPSVLLSMRNISYAPNSKGANQTLTAYLTCDDLLQTHIVRLSGKAFGKLKIKGKANSFHSFRKGT